METTDLTLISEKTGTKLNVAAKDTRIILKKEINCLEVDLDENQKFGKHIKYTTMNAEKKLAVTTRILSNVGRQKE